MKRSLVEITFFDWCVDKKVKNVSELLKHFFLMFKQPPQYSSRAVFFVPTKCSCIFSRSSFPSLLQFINKGIFFQNDSAVIYWHGKHVWLVSTEKTGILFNFQMMLICPIMDTFFKFDYAHQSFFPVWLTFYSQGTFVAT